MIAPGSRARARRRRAGGCSASWTAGSATTRAVGTIRPRTAPPASRPICASACSRPGPAWKLRWRWQRHFPGRAGGAWKWIDELIWREFYSAILEEHPHVLARSFRPEYQAIRWDDDEDRFRAWCEGRTGYPFVDAAMRQLASRGLDAQPRADGGRRASSPRTCSSTGGGESDSSCSA